MGIPFVNEKLTEEQRKEFVSRGIKRPWSERIANPIYRTIDAERNMCLWHLGNLGRDFFRHHMFLFEWNGEEHYVIMEYVDPNPKEDYIAWSISVYEKCKIFDQPFAGDLEEALIKYELDGSPEQQGDTKIEVDFKGEKTMAYINEFVPEGEERSFLIPGYKKERTPGVWTIEKEKDYILFNYHTDKDNPMDEYFAFVYKGRVIDMILDGSEFVDPDTRKWKITRIFIPEDLNREEVLSELRKAVMAYGCHGSPIKCLSTGKAVTDF